LITYKTAANQTKYFPALIKVWLGGVNLQVHLHARRGTGIETSTFFTPLSETVVAPYKTDSGRHYRSRKRANPTNGNPTNKKGENQVNLSHLA
jgi:hypothetical protein